MVDAAGESVPQREALRRFAAEIADLRPLPAVAMQVLATSERGPASARDLADLIATDQVLAARLLRLANSAYYGVSREISTVQEAVVLLGFRQVRSTAVAASILGAMPPATSIDYGEFWEFSVTVGLVAELTAESYGTSSEHAFSAGILHNIGRLALDQYAPALLADAIADASERHTSVHEAQRVLLGYTDADLGGEIAAAWLFPPDLVEAVASHTRPSTMFPDRTGLAAITAQARVFAQSQGLSDGVDCYSVIEPDQQWTRPPLSDALHRAGGVAALAARAAAFAQSVAAV